MFDKLTTRAFEKVGRLQRELDEAKAALAEVLDDNLMANVVLAKRVGMTRVTTSLPITWIEAAAKVLGK